MAQAAERRYLAHESQPDLAFSRSRGSWLFDANGRKYVDFLMGWCVGNFGWGNALIEKPAAKYRGPDYVYPGFSYPPWAELARLLLSIAPRGLAKCFRATGGSEAVDLALQAAMIATGRSQFLSLEGSYHGNTIAALSVGSSENRRKRKNLLAGCHKVEPPLDAKALSAIEKRLKGRAVAAFIMEPISMNLGVLIPAEGFMQELQRLCRKHGTLLVMDEVATGFGRTGALFACEHFGVEPDIMTIAKAMTDGVGGMGAMLATAKVARAMEKDGSFYSTYGWHPRSVDVAIATLRYIKANGRSLFAGVHETSEYFRLRLATMPFARKATVRVVGLAVGIDFGNEAYCDKIADRCRKAGLLVSAEGRTVLLIPALNIDRATAKRGLDIFQKVVSGTT